jgi:2-hydroxy-3-keto-5-methylthiopentenyl-1-phosphate phosphatase
MAAKFVPHHRAFYEQTCLKEDIELEWKIPNFIEWAKSKDYDRLVHSPPFSFFITGLKETFKFAMLVKPRVTSQSANANANANADRTAIFLQNLNKV